VSGVAVGSPPDGRPGVWLDFSARLGSDQDIERTGWECDLVEGAIADALNQQDLGHVTGSTIDAVLPNGTHEDIGGGMGDVKAGQSFTNASDASIQSELSTTLKADNLTPVSINILHADQPAPAVIAETADPKEAATSAASTVKALFGGSHPPTFEGFYFEVLDTSGNPLFALSYAYRSASGRQWVTRSLADTFSLQTL
jgi:hypothetical protein